MPKALSCDNLKPTGFGVKWPSCGTFDLVQYKWGLLA